MSPEGEKGQDITSRVVNNNNNKRKLARNKYEYQYSSSSVMSARAVRLRGCRARRILVFGC